MGGNATGAKLEVLMDGLAAERTYAEGARLIEPVRRALLLTQPSRTRTLAVTAGLIWTARDEPTGKVIAPEEVGTLFMLRALEKEALREGRWSGENFGALRTYHLIPTVLALGIGATTAHHR